MAAAPDLLLELESARLFRWVTGPFAENSYLIVCTATGRAAIVDPGYQVLESVEAALLDVSNVDNAPFEKVTVERILLTHAHVDHIMGLADVAERFDVPIHCHSDDQFFVENYVASAAAFGLKVEPAPMPTDWWSDGDTVTVGEIEFGVVHTPGHSPGSVCLTFPGAVFTGDTVMGYSIGRTDLPMGSMETLVRSITQKIYTLGDDRVTLPGHMDPTSIGEEKQFNQFVKVS